LRPFAKLFLNDPVLESLLESLVVLLDTEWYKDKIIFRKGYSRRTDLNLKEEVSGWIL
jgi:hypothetical protein